MRGAKIVAVRVIPEFNASSKKQQGAMLTGSTLYRDRPVRRHDDALFRLFGGSTETETTGK